jgi:hypothetical protein
MLGKGPEARLLERPQPQGEEAMAETKSTTDGRSHNQPSHEAQVKGGQHSHSGSQNSETDSSSRSHNQPSYEAQVKGGEHSHSGSGK